MHSCFGGDLCKVKFKLAESVSQTEQGQDGAVKTASGTWDWMRRWIGCPTDDGVEGGAGSRCERVRLSTGGTVSYPALQGSRRVEVLSGSIWLTRSSDPVDHVLGPGDVMVMESGDAAVVIEALKAGEFVVAFD